METVSDYVVVDDRGAVLEIGGDVDETFPFAVRGNADLGERAMATLMLRADRSPQNLSWTLQINDAEVITRTHNEDRFDAALQEVFQGSVLRVGNNTATVRVTGGTGRIRVSDIVIHFQVRVASQPA
ncbi:MAG TPA: hypothetical protein VK887_12580 [Pseudonocardiaceae bacterium]|nr:hypothetical protein [Pseudonocardiaceae bacterium]